MKFKNLFNVILVTVAAFILTYAYAEDLSSDILVSDAWVQILPPSQTSTAAYMTITNNSNKDAVLVSVSSDIAGSAEIHQMSEMAGMMNMAMAVNLKIPAQSKVTLQPAGFHIMLIDLKKPIINGDIVPIMLHFQDSRTFMVRAKVHGQ